MEAENKTYMIWVNWEERIVSFHPVEGFESLPFGSEENWQANLRILLTEGFRFQ